MKIRIQYSTKQERNQVIEDNQDKYLKAEENIKEGNFLIFTDVKPIEIEIEELRQIIDILLGGDDNE